MLTPKRLMRTSVGLAGLALIGFTSGCSADPGPQVTHGVVSAKDFHDTRRHYSTFTVTVIQCESATNPDCLQQTFEVDSQTWDALDVGDSYPLGYHDPLSNTAPPPSPAPESAESASTPASTSR